LTNFPLPSANMRVLASLAIAFSLHTATSPTRAKRSRPSFSRARWSRRQSSFYLACLVVFVASRKTDCWCLVSHRGEGSTRADRYVLPSISFHRSARVGCSLDSICTYRSWLYSRVRTDRRSSF
jgi:hypothetical protein